jgi:hypothetical protein
MADAAVDQPVLDPADKIRLLLNLKHALMHEVLANHRALEEQHRRDSVPRPDLPNPVAQEHLLLLGVCLPEPVQEAIMVSHDALGITPIFARTYNAVRRYIGREQPWVASSSKRFRMLVYAPLERWCWFAELKSAMAANKRPVVCVCCCGCGCLW